jgi:hypothetical protein
MLPLIYTILHAYPVMLYMDAVPIYAHFVCFLIVCVTGVVLSLRLPSTKPMLFLLIG